VAGADDAQGGDAHQQPQGQETLEQLQDAPGQCLALGGAVRDDRGVQRGAQEGPLHLLGDFPHLRALATLMKKVSGRTSLPVTAAIARPLT